MYIHELPFTCKINYAYMKNSYVDKPCELFMSTLEIIVMIREKQRTIKNSLTINFFYTLAYLNLHDIKNITISHVDISYFVYM